MRRPAVILVSSLASLIVAMGLACSERLLLPGLSVDGAGGLGGHVAGTGGRPGTGAGTGGTSQASSGGSPFDSLVGGAGGLGGFEAVGGQAAGGLFGQNRSNNPFPRFGGRGPSCTQPVHFNIQRSQVLISLGKSSSMTTKFGDGTRLSVVQQALKAIITANQYSINFGYQEFPGTTACAMVDGCCVKTGAIQPSPTNSQGQAIQDALQCMPPSMTSGCATTTDSRPVAAALDNAASSVFNTSDTVQRLVILIVDGEPGCGAQVPDDACQSATQALAQLGLNKVQTFVVAVGADPLATPSCLTRIALEANTPLLKASDPTQLMTGLDNIVSNAADWACTLRLTSPTDPMTLTLAVDNVLIPANAPNGGWDVAGTDFPKIHLKGDSCALVQQKVKSDSQIDVFGCPL